MPRTSSSLQLLPRKPFFLEEKIVSVVHVQDRVFLESVLVITGRQEYAEPVGGPGGAGQRRHQFADAAMSVFSKVLIDVKRRTRGRDSQQIFSARPVQSITMEENRLVGEGRQLPLER